MHQTWLLLAMCLYKLAYRADQHLFRTVLLCGVTPVRYLVYLVADGLLQTQHVCPSVTVVSSNLCCYCCPTAFIVVDLTGPLKYCMSLSPWGHMQICTGAVFDWRSRRHAADYQLLAFEPSALQTFTWQSATTV